MGKNRNKNEEKSHPKISKPRDPVHRPGASEASHEQRGSSEPTSEWLKIAERAANAGFYDWDMLTGQLTWSEGFHRLFGLPSDAPPSFETWLAVVHPDDRESAVARINDSVTQRSSLRNEYRIILPDGDGRWIGAFGNTFYDEAGTPLRNCGVCIDITERRQIEQAFFEANQRLQALMSALPIGVSFSNDPTCQHITGNPVVLGQFEVQGEDNLSASALDTEAPGRQVRYFQGGRQITDADLPLQRAVAENRAVPSVELEVQLPSGRRWWADTSAAPIRDREDKVIGGVALTVDITERKRALDDLRESKERYERLVQTANSIIVQMDRDGTMRFMNLYGQQFFGYSLDELLGKNVKMLVSSTESTGRNLNPTADIILQDPDSVSDNVTENILRSGERVWVSWRSAAIKDDTGNIIGNLAIGQDITQLKRAEEALKAYSDQLERLVEERTRQLDRTNKGLLKEVELRRKAEQQFRTLADNAPDIILRFDRNLRYLFINQTFERIYGLRIRDFMGKTDREVGFPDRVADVLTHTIEHVLQTGEPMSLEWDIPLVTGTKRISSRVAPEFDDDGQVESALVVSRDVTDQFRLEEQLRQSQKMEALGTLTGGIAHDFNNLLAAMIGFTEMAREDLPEGSNERRYMERVLEAGLRGRELVKQLLAFSRKGEQEKTPLLLSRALADSIQLLRASLPTSIHIHTETASESGFILADPVQVEQVIMNLCTNAAHAMRERGGNITLSLSDYRVPPSSASDTLRPGAYMRLMVRDTGCGMTPEVQARVFDPFFTTKTRGEGSGLGLSVVHGIVEQSGGHITVESEPGRGSTFTVYLPVVREQTPAEAIRADTFPTGTERVLFVDDETALAEMGWEVLERLGYRVTVATSSAEALAVFAADPAAYDVIVTDQTMPEMTGMELAGKILVVRPDIPIILCTGFSHLVDEAAARAAGIRAFAMKPLTRSEIAKTMRTVLDQQVATPSFHS